MLCVRCVRVTGARPAVADMHKRGDIPTHNHARAYNVKVPGSTQARPSIICRLKNESERNAISCFSRSNECLDSLVFQYTHIGARSITRTSINSLVRSLGMGMSSAESTPEKPRAPRSRGVTPTSHRTQPRAGALQTPALLSSLAEAPRHASPNSPSSAAHGQARLDYDILFSGTAGGETDESADSHPFRRPVVPHAAPSPAPHRAHR